MSAFCRMMNKAKLSVDYFAIVRTSYDDQPVLILDRLRRFKAARGYSLSLIAAILKAERERPPIKGTPIAIPGLSRAVNQFLQDHR